MRLRRFIEINLETPETNILASTSPQRKELFSPEGLSFGILKNHTYKNADQKNHFFLVCVMIC